MSLKNLHCVLGDRQLFDGAVAASRSALVYEGGVVVGLGCFELLYGPYAEMALAVRDRSAVHVVNELIQELTPHVRRHRAHTLQAIVTRDQQEIAALVPGAELRDGRLELRLEPG